MKNIKSYFLLGSFPEHFQGIALFPAGNILSIADLQHEQDLNLRWSWDQTMLNNIVQ